MRKIMAVMALAFFFTFVSCHSAGDPKKIDRAEIVQPVSYGNNLYYFSAVEASFGKSLGAFLDKNRNLEIVTIAPSDTGFQYGYTVGYFVAFRLNTER
ncbi:MAG: hypothetical protein AAB575_03685 [Patescibacteria group bacterium]